MILYGLKTCSTCRNALRSLGEMGLEPDFRDVRRDAMPQEFVARCVETFGEKLINRRSTTWRGLTESDRDLPPADLIARHPAVMKRPVIEGGPHLWLGWSDEVRADIARTSASA